MLFLEILTLILWTVLIVIAGYSAGVANTKDEREVTPTTVVNNAMDPDVQSRLDELWATYEDENRLKMAPMSPGERDILQTLWKAHKDNRQANQDATPLDGKNLTMYNGDSLDEWAEAIYDRLKRVERKAGMSV